MGFWDFLKNKRQKNNSQATTKKTFEEKYFSRILKDSEPTQKEEKTKTFEERYFSRLIKIDQDLQQEKTEEITAEQEIVNSFSSNFELKRLLEIDQNLQKEEVISNEEITDLYTNREISDFDKLLEDIRFVRWKKMAIYDILKTYELPLINLPNKKGDFLQFLKSNFFLKANSSINLQYLRFVILWAIDFYFKNKRFSIKEFQKYTLPITNDPYIQTQIANFFLNFYSHEEALKRELKLRKKQFEYYKNFKISTINEEFNKKIEEFASLRGGTYTREFKFEEAGSPLISAQEIASLPTQFRKLSQFVEIDFEKEKSFFEYGDLLVSKHGKFTVYLGDEKGIALSGIFVIKHDQDAKYLIYALTTEKIKHQIKKLLKRVSNNTLSFCLREIKSIEIPLPSLEEQNRISNFLDDLYEICERPDKGLNLLIKQNQEQLYIYMKKIFNCINDM